MCFVLQISAGFNFHFHKRGHKLSGSGNPILIERFSFKGNVLVTFQDFLVLNHQLLDPNPPRLTLPFLSFCKYSGNFNCYKCPLFWRRIHKRTISFFSNQGPFQNVEIPPRESIYLALAYRSSYAHGLTAREKHSLFTHYKTVSYGMEGTSMENETWTNGTNSFFLNIT